VRLSPDMIKREVEGSVSGLATTNSQRLYGCQSNVVIVDPSCWMVRVSSDVTRTICLIFCLCINFLLLMLSQILSLNRSSSTGLASNF
jgi:hypothetical protein